MAKKAEATLLVKIKEEGKEQLTKLQSGFKKLKETTVNTGLALTAFGTTVAGTLAASVKAYAKQEKAVNSLEAALKGQGLEVSTLSKKYQALASEIQKKTTFGDEEILQAQAMAQSMVGNIAITDDLIKATVDFAAAQGIDLNSAFNLVGKSVGSNTNALGRYGIEIDASASRAEKMAAVTSALSSKFDGAAEAQAQGLGSLKQLTNAFGDFLELIGKAIAPAVVFITKKMTDFISSFSDNDIEEFIDNMRLGFASLEDIVQSFIEPLSRLPLFFDAIGKASKKAMELDFSGAASAFSEWEETSTQIAAIQADRRAKKQEELFNEIAEKRIKRETKTEKINTDIALDFSKSAEDKKKNLKDKYREQETKDLEEVNKERQKFEEEQQKNAFASQEEYFEDRKRRIQDSLLDETLVQSQRKRLLLELDKTEVSLSEARKERLKKEADEHRARMEQISSSVQTFTSRGLQGISSQFASFIGDSFLPGIGGAVGGVFDLLSQNTDQFKETLKNLFGPEFIGNILSNLTTLIEQLPAILTNIIDYLSQNMPSIVEKLIAAIIGSIPEMTSAFIQAFIKMAADPSFIAALAGAIVKGFVKGVADAAGDITESIKKAVKDAVRELGTVKISVNTRVGGGGGSFFENLGSGIASGFRFNEGGLVPNIRGYAGGGIIDNTLAALTPGEFVINRNSAAANMGLLESINNSRGRSVSGGSNITLIVNGGLLGDRETARQLAVAIDQELLKLRQGNESRAFDSGIF